MRENARGGKGGTRNSFFLPWPLEMQVFGVVVGGCWGGVGGGFVFGGGGVLGGGGRGGM